MEYECSRMLFSFGYQDYIQRHKTLHLARLYILIQSAAASTCLIEEFHTFLSLLFLSYVSHSKSISSREHERSYKLTLSANEQNLQINPAF